jgi:hypothetical protein
MIASTAAKFYRQRVSLGEFVRLVCVQLGDWERIKVSICSADSIIGIAASGPDDRYSLPWLALSILYLIIGTTLTHRSRCSLRNSRPNTEIDSCEVNLWAYILTQI